VNDEVYLRFKIKPRLLKGHKIVDSRFYVHDSVSQVRRDLVEKRFLMSRDVGSKYYPMVEGASYRYQVADEHEKEDDYLVTFFSGQRSNGVGYVEDGVIDLGIGRNVKSDDGKGLPEGTPDNTVQELSFSMGLFKTRDVVPAPGQEPTEASLTYELNHLERSSPILFKQHENYVADVEMGQGFLNHGEGDGKSDERHVGQPLQTNISFFGESPHSSTRTPAEIIEIRKDPEQGDAYVATYLSRNGERLHHFD